MTETLLTAVVWLAIVLVGLTTAIASGSWVMLPIGLIIILAFIAGKLHKGW